MSNDDGDQIKETINTLEEEVKYKRGDQPGTKTS